MGIPISGEVGEHDRATASRMEKPAQETKERALKPTFLIIAYERSLLLFDMPLPC